MDMSLADSRGGENNTSSRLTQGVQPFRQFNWYYFANFCFHSFDTVGYVANTRSTNS